MLPQWSLSPSTCSFVCPWSPTSHSPQLHCVIGESIVATVRSGCSVRSRWSSRRSRAQPLPRHPPGHRSVDDEAVRRCTTLHDSVERCDSACDCAAATQLTVGASISGRCSQRVDIRPAAATAGATLTENPRRRPLNLASRRRRRRPSATRGIVLGSSHESSRAPWLAADADPDARKGSIPARKLSDRMGYRARHHRGRNAAIGATRPHFESHDL